MRDDMLVVRETLNISLHTNESDACTIRKILVMNQSAHSILMINICGKTSAHNSMFRYFSLEFLQVFREIYIVCAVNRASSDNVERQYPLFGVFFLLLLSREDFNRFIC